MIIKETSHKASLILQIFLYLNVHLSAIWLLLYGYFLLYNVSNFGKIQTLLTVSGFLLAIPSEALRLYLGYSGNLRGKVSDLAGFWIISTLIQLPIHIYLSLTTDDILLLKILQYLMLSFIIVEIPIGFLTSRKLSIHQAQLYHIKLLHSKATEEKQE